MYKVKVIKLIFGERQRNLAYVMEYIFTYGADRMVITEKEKRVEIIRDIHKGAGENVRARALSSHFGRNSTYEKVVKRFYWYSIYEDVNNLIK